MHELWNQILNDADKDRDGKINYNEFESAMKDVFRKSWLRKCDQSPSKSSPSPVKSFDLMDLSPVKFQQDNCLGEGSYYSPVKMKKQKNG